MDPQPIQPIQPDAAPEVTPPQYVAGTNIIDRSAAQVATPQVSVSAPTSTAWTDPGANQPASSYRDQAASSAFAEAKVLICGVASSTSYVLLLYFVKNLWTTGIISGLLACATVVFATIEYRKSNKTSPLTVIGLSAATITLVYIANVVIAQIVLRSAFSSYGL